MIFDLFSKRQKRLRGDVPDVYVYDKIPDALKVQIIHIWNDVLGSNKDYYSYHNKVQLAYKLIVDTLLKILIEN